MFFIFIVIYLWNIILIVDCLYKILKYDVFLLQLLLIISPSIPIINIQKTANPTSDEYQVKKQFNNLGTKVTGPMKQILQVICILTYYLTVDYVNFKNYIVKISIIIFIQYISTEDIFIYKSYVYYFINIIGVFIK